MPSLQVPPELVVPSAFSYESSELLADEINAVLTANGTPHSVRPISEIETLGSELHLTRPVHVLHAIGKATAGPPTVADALLQTAAQWAAVRYLWAFGMPSGSRRMRLSTHTDGVRYHHRQALSEHFGLGCAYMLMEERIAGRFDPPIVFDVDNEADDLVRAGHLRKPLGARGRRRPDLLMLVNPLTAPWWAVIECKGCSSDRGTSVAQMADGVQQALTLEGTSYPTRHFVFGAIAPRGDREIVAHGVEVARPGDWEMPRPTSGPASDDLRYRSWAHQLRFSGSYAEAQRRVPSERQEAVNPGTVQRRELSGLPFLGTTALIGGEDGGLEVFFGLDARLWLNYADPTVDAGPVEREVRTLHAERAERPLRDEEADSSYLIEEETSARRAVASVGTDGTVVAVQTVGQDSSVTT